MKLHRHRVTVVLEVDVPAGILYTRGFIREVVGTMVSMFGDEHDDVVSYDIKDIDDQGLKVVVEVDK